MVRKRKGDKNHYYFYWVVEDFHEIEEFEKEYTDAYNLKYAGMLRALKRRIRWQWLAGCGIWVKPKNVFSTPWEVKDTLCWEVVMGNKEQKFYSALRDLFVGAKLEGQSGYVNLMNIKTEYFEKIRI